MAWNVVQQTPSPSIPYVAICCPYFSSVSMEWVLKTLGPLLWIPQPDFVKIPKLARGIQNLDTLRNELVKAALADKAVTHILFLDSDIVAESPTDINQSLRMLLQCNVPCASGLYRAKQLGGFNYAMWMRNPTGGIGYLPIAQWTGNWLPVSVIGFGFVLLKRECFERVPYPWFEWGEPSPSEDFVYSEKLNKVGIEIRVFTEVKLSHIGTLKVHTEGKVTVLDA
ncbi:hypothetical protein MUP77_17660 [Candidatus Bathyarchaeota archaeon]|nr:hypothetical protein [Candidatus Bathyarchaeota archaeon]